ncbi:MAG: FtsX-like permease family protein [Microthrixaceae bacterium]
MLARFVLADLLRNPRRTLSTLVGVALGVGLFCGVLFFVDGLSASMTQRAVAPLPIDMQHVVAERIGGSLLLTQTVDPDGVIGVGRQVGVTLELANGDDVAANEVTIRSLPSGSLSYVPGSARLDGAQIAGAESNPFAQGPGLSGLNLGTMLAGEAHRLEYRLEARRQVAVDDAARSTFSSREQVTPIPANRPAPTSLEEVADRIAALDGVASARALSFGDLGVGAIADPASGTSAPGPTRVFAFDAGYAARDDDIRIESGGLRNTGAVISAEVAAATGAGVGDAITVALPDGSSITERVSGIADLSRAQALFSSRRGGDLETFVYVRNSVVVSPTVFADTVLPAYERAAAAGGGRLKSPPVREVDIALQRHLLDADPATALRQTERIGAAVRAVAASDDNLLDNISNTLTVAEADAKVAKALFVFLGVPGGLLAAMLSAYAGVVLAEAQRREQATLRIRGAGRRQLLAMLALRTSVLTATGSVVGLSLGYLAAAITLGQDSLGRASAASLAVSAAVGAVGGFVATGSALYLTGRRSIDREINEDRALLATRPPLWRRAWLDVLGLAVVAVGTALALRLRAFDGEAGSVYFGRAVRLNLRLLVLPIGIWVSASLLSARGLGRMLERGSPRSAPQLGRPLGALLRRSVGRRPWAIGNGVVIVSLIVGLTVSLAAFTASYDRAKSADARFANGADFRITPGPSTQLSYGVGDAHRFRTPGVAASTPVIWGRDNVVLRSRRTSDPANLVAVDPTGFLAVAPVRDEHFVNGTAAEALGTLGDDPSAIMLSSEMAEFLRAKPGDSLDVLLVRGTDEQAEVRLHITGLFERLPGFPDGADALMAIDAHSEAVPSKRPDFFLAAAADAGARAEAERSLRGGPLATDRLALDSATTTLASDQSSLAALNVAGLVSLDSSFALAMVVVTIGIFVFGLLLTRRREYVTLRAQGLEARSIRLLIGAEAATVALAGTACGMFVGVGMGFYFVTVLRPLFVLTPVYSVPVAVLAAPALLVVVATLVASFVGSSLVNRLNPTELLRDE